MFLDVFVESIYGKQRQAGKDCLRNYRKHAAELQRHAGRRLRLSDLSQPLVSRWLLDELGRGLSPYTVTGKRSSILAVWSLARDMGYVTSIPRAPTIRRPDLTVRVWTAADVAELAEAARSLSGTIVGCLPRGEYLSTMILAAWWSGLRRRDLHRIRRDSISNPSRNARRTVGSVRRARRTRQVKGRAASPGKGPGRP